MKRLTFEQAFRKQLQVQRPLTAAEARRVSSPCAISNEPFKEGDVVLYFGMTPSDASQTACLQKAKASVLKSRQYKYTMKNHQLFPLVHVGQQKYLTFRQAFKRQLAKAKSRRVAPTTGIRSERCFVSGERFTFGDVALCFAVMQSGHAALRYGKREALAKKKWKYRLLDARASEIPVVTDESLHVDPPLDSGTTMNLGQIMIGGEPT